MSKKKGDRMYTIKRTKEEIDEVLNKISHRVRTGATEFHDTTYEEGLRDMFVWLTTDEPDGFPA